MVTLRSCGLFHRCPSTQHRLSNELSFIAIIPATLLFYANPAATNLALAIDTRTGTFSFIVFTSRSRNWDYQNNRTVVRKYPPEGVRSACKGDGSNSASYNGCSELTNCNWRSCQLKEIGWGKPRHLWLLSHLQLRRVLICLDADDQVDIHKAGVPACWSCSSDIRPTRTVSLPIYWLKQWNKLLWYGSSESLVSVALFHRLHWSVISFYFLTAFIGELKDQFQQQLVVKYSDKADSPPQSIENNWTTTSGSDSSWNWLRDCKWSFLISCSPVV